MIAKTHTANGGDSGAFWALYDDARWQERKYAILNRDHYACTDCGASRGLQVHHNWYVHGLAPWEYPDRALRTLCRTCHERVTDADRALKADIERAHHERELVFLIRRGGTRLVELVDELRSILGIAA